MIEYENDILGEGFEKGSILLSPDYDGEAIATLIRKKTKTDSRKSILYIHGYNDYYFQKEMANRFNEQGYNFYAIDLRKYGRSYRPYQQFNDIRSLETYFEEIEKSLAIIKEEGSEKIGLLGHSTGGLISTLFASKHNSFDALILNSPFFKFNISPFIKLTLPPLVFLAKFFPSLKIKGSFSKEYGVSMHTSGYGEWDYNLNWKPHLPPKITIGWLRAIYLGQKQILKKFSIKQPVLIMHSNHSASSTASKTEMQEQDSVLNVDDIKNISKNIIGDVSLCEIKNGVHDLVLSKPEVREEVYSTMFKWLINKGI